MMLADGAGRIRRGSVLASIAVDGRMDIILVIVGVRAVGSGVAPTVYRNS